MENDSEIRPEGTKPEIEKVDEDPWYGYEPPDGSEETAEDVDPAGENQWIEEANEIVGVKTPETPKSMGDPFLDYTPDEWRGQALVVDKRYKLPRWIVEGVFRRRTLLFIPGEAGTGKTAWAIDTAHMIQSGAETDSAGRKIITHGEVLLISQDTFKADVIEMVRRRGANFHVWPRLNVRLVTMGKNLYTVVKDEENFNRIVEHCTMMRMAGTSVVVIVLDSLATIARVNLNDNIVASQVMDIVRELSERTNTGIMIIHHPTKEDFKSGKRAMLSGGYQLEAGSDFIQYLQAVKSGEFPGGKKLLIKMHRGRAADVAPDVVMNYTYRLDDGTPTMRFIRSEDDPQDIEIPGLKQANEWTDIEGPKTAGEIGQHLWPDLEKKQASTKFRRLISKHMFLVGEYGGTAYYQRKDGIKVFGPEERIGGPGKRERREESI